MVKTKKTSTKTKRKSITDSKKKNIQKDPRPKKPVIEKLPDIFPIVGIGASAGGLAPIIELTENIAKDTDAAFVIIQHLDPNAASNLAEILAQKAALPVEIITNDLVLKKSHIYVMPPDSSLTLVDNKLVLVPRSDLSDVKRLLPIDHFFKSLAEYAQTNAISVVLSGLGSDGAQGSIAVSSGGGLTFAQDKETAKYPSMPMMAIETGYIDFVLSPEKIAKEITRITARSFPRTAVHEVKDFADQNAIDQVLIRVYNKLGSDFRHYKKTTINRRIHRRMALNKIANLDGYLEFLDSNPTEIDELCDDILIKVTTFFRDNDSFETLKNKVFPKLVDSNKDEPIRIWVPGCSTGEEAYSLAIALNEFVSDKARNPEIQIFATDISEKAIKVARDGFYLEGIREKVSKGRLQRFFTKAEGGYRICKSIRDVCVFAVQNIIQDPPFSRVDLISCRNLMIYFSGPLQKRVFPILHYALKPSGFLYLGSSETAAGYSDLFEIFDKKHKIYLKKFARIPQFYEHSPSSSVEITQERGPKKDKKDIIYDEKKIVKIADSIILSRLAPAGFVINENLDIIQIRGDTSRYIAPQPGTPSFNLMKTIRDELRYPIRSLISKVKKSARGQRRSNVIIAKNEVKTAVSIEILPLKIPEISNRFYIIVLSAIGRIPASTKEPESRDEELSKSRHLELELSDTKEQLQAVIEEYESSNEELKSTNEEILSSNEELQSTNEELQTAKEEIQSANEELITLNEELQNRNDELSKTNDDLINLFKSTRIPLIMLGQDLRVRRFSESATELFRLIETDIGRAFSDIKASVDTKIIIDGATKVIETMQVVSEDIRTDEGVWYSMSIKPYVASDNKVDGVIVTFIDVHALRSIVDDNVLLWAEDIIWSVREPLLILNKKNVVQLANTAFYNAFKTVSSETLGKKFNLLSGKLWDLPELNLLINNVIKNKQSFEDYRVEKHYPNVGLKVYLVNGREIHRKGKGTGLILISIIDVSSIHQQEKLKQEKQKAENANTAKSAFLANMSHEIRTPLAAITGFCELLQRQNLDERQKKEFLDSVLKNSRHLQLLVDDVLDLSKIEAQEITIEETAVHLPSLIDEIFSTLKQQSKRIDISYSFKTPSPDIIISDPTKLRQIYHNLASNALKFTQFGSVSVEVEFENKSEEASLTLSIKDTGCGIPKKYQSKIFDPFQQSDVSSTRRYGGTGLGLSISRKLARLLGGDLKLVQSESGKGSTFSATVAIKLPPKVKFNPPSSVKEILDKTGVVDGETISCLLNGVKVLLVEDAPELQVLFTHILKKAGAEVHAVSEGRLGVDAALQNVYDVVFMDIQLPDIDGYEATELLRAKGYKNPIIALTAHALAEEKNRCFSIGCNDYRSKPIRAEDLIGLVAKWSGRSST